MPKLYSLQWTSSDHYFLNDFLQYRCEILNCFRRLLEGLGPSSTSAHKDVYKCVRTGLTDKSLAVRSTAAKVCEH